MTIELSQFTSAENARRTLDQRLLLGIQFKII